MVVEAGVETPLYYHSARHSRHAVFPCDFDLSPAGVAVNAGTASAIETVPASAKTRPNVDVFSDRKSVV